MAIGKLTPGGFSAPDGNGVGEEVHRNKVTFDYIVENGLWYREGIAAFFDKAAKAVGDDVDFASKTVNLPRASIEVKANWIVIDEKDKPKFHWNYNGEGQLLGLVAMHIISKDLPNWFWCTFEHVDNPGRGDFIGIHDSVFGEQALLPLITGDSLQPVLTYNGRPDANWYFLDAGNGSRFAACRPISSGRSRSRPSPSRRPSTPESRPARRPPSRAAPHRLTEEIRQ